MNLDDLRPLAAGVVVLGELWPVGLSSLRPKEVFPMVARILGLHRLNDHELIGLHARNTGLAPAPPAALSRLRQATVFVTDAEMPGTHLVCDEAAQIMFPQLSALTPLSDRSQWGRFDTIVQLLPSYASRLTSLTIELREVSSPADRRDACEHVLVTVS